MPTKTITNFSGGQTIRTRVGVDDDAILERCNGFRVTDGRLVPENVPSRLSTSAVDTMPEQTPFAFKEAGDTTLIARDSDSAFREMTPAGVWGGAGDTLGILEANTPARMVDQIIYPSDGPNARLMAYEPGSGSTKLRPVALKAPTDYLSTEKPTVTPSADPTVQLFDCDSGNAWTTASTGCSVDNTVAGKSVFTISDDAIDGPPTAKFTKSLGDTGISLTGKRYLVLDIKITGDNQTSTIPGNFANDSEMLLSGYSINLWPNTTCTPTLIQSYQIPRLDPNGKVHRICLYVGDHDGETVKGVDIRTNSVAWHIPTSEDYTITVYSATFEDDWTPPANLLLPVAAYPLSPWYTLLPTVVSTGRNSATILQTFDEAETNQDPESPLAKYCYCFAAKNLLGAAVWTWMVSNPSNYSDEVFCDPWRTYTVDITLPAGPISVLASAPTAAGTGYTVGDILTITTGGTGGTARVLTITGGGGTGPVGTVELVTAGTNYTSGAGKATTGGTGSNCTLAITTALTPLTEYGDYLTHVLIYRQIYDGTLIATDTPIGWSTETFANIVAISATPTYEDAGVDADATHDDADLPAELEINNDYPVWKSAEYAVYWKQRVVAGCLEWNNTTETWSRPGYLALSGYQKSWAWSTGVGDTEPNVEDGGLLYDFAVTGSEIRGLVSKDEELFVFFDNEWFMFRGDSPALGYQNRRMGPIGLVSNRTLADCGTAIVWHDGHHFYAYSGNEAEPISELTVDSTLIDFTKPHNACYYDGEYRFFCEYDDVWSIITYKLATRAWRIRRTVAGPTLCSLYFAGMCTDGETLFGLTIGGNAVDVYGSATTEWRDAGTASPTRQVYTQYVQLSEDEVHVTEGIVEAYTADTGPHTLTGAYYTQGLKDASTTGKILLVLPARTQYHSILDLTGNACAIRYEYTGTTCPTILSLGIQGDGHAPLEFQDEATNVHTWVRYFDIAQPGQDVRINQVMVDAFLATGTATLAVTVTPIGTHTETGETVTGGIIVVPERTRYYQNLTDVWGYRAKVTVVYTGTTEPDIYGISLVTDGDAPLSFNTDSATVRSWTKQMTLSAPGQDVRVGYLAVDAITAESGGVDLVLVATIQGQFNTSHTETINVVSTQRRYYIDLSDKFGSYVKLSATYTGSTPPAVYMFDLLADDNAPMPFNTDTAASTQSWNRIINLTQPGNDVRIGHIAVDAVTTEVAGVDLALSAAIYGQTDSTFSETLHIIPGQTRYYVDLTDKWGYKVELTAAYTMGTTPPKVYELTVVPDPHAPILFTTETGGRAWTKDFTLADAGKDALITEVILDADASIDTLVTITLDSYGLQDDSRTYTDKTLEATRRRHHFTTNGKGHYAKVTVTCEETTADVYGINLMVDGVIVR